MTNSNQNHASQSGQDAAGSARDVTVPVSGSIVFPKVGTEIDPSHRPGHTLIRYKNEEIGRGPFSLPVFTVGEAIQLYTKLKHGDKGVLITAEVTGSNDYGGSLRVEWEKDRSLSQPWPFSDWAPIVEEDSAIDIEGFLTYDPAVESIRTLFKENLVHSFGYSILNLETHEKRGPNWRLIFGSVGYDEEVVDFSFRKRNYNNLAAFCRVGSVCKINDGRETVFWRLVKKHGLVVKVSNPN